MTPEELKDLSVHQLAVELILKKQEAKTIEDQMDAIKAELLERDFEKETIEGITVMRKSRATISLLPDADPARIKERYPDLVEVKDVLDTTKISEVMFKYLQEKNPEAIRQEYSVDKNLLHKCCKDYTQQKITTYLEVK